MQTFESKPKAALIFNPAAGRAGNFDALRRKLDERFELVLTTTEPQGATSGARAALELGADLVIAAGGDGTVSMVASVLRSSTVPLGIVPQGTSNSLAAALGLPDDLDAAVDVLTVGDRRTLDTAIANGRTMLLHASVGLHATAVTGASRDAKKRWGVLAYLVEGAAQLAKLSPFEVVIETESEIVRCRAVNVSIANIAPRKTVLAQGPAVISPADGLLGVTVVAASGLAEAVATGLHLFGTAGRGAPATRDNVGHFSAKHVRIETTPSQPIVIDGEDAGEDRLDVECVPRSLSVVVPRELELLAADVDDRKLEGFPGIEVAAREDFRCRR